MNLSIEDFDYELPSELIAQHPSETRSGSRLLCVGASLADRRFTQLPQLLAPGDLLVFNDTRVIKARLTGEKEASGGRVEVLIERTLSEHEALARVRASKPPRTGSAMRLADSIEVRVLAREGEFYRLRFQEDVCEVLERHGRVPLPPYIAHAPRAEDERRYQ